ncbi:MAG: IclR family transcriptional regulator [Anaerolineae bacterium]
MVDYTVAVLEDAISLLKVLQSRRESMTLAEITAASGFVKNKVFRILYTLEKHHLVERDEEGRYRLGLGLLELAQHVRNQLSLTAACRPTLDWLVAETGESIFVGVISGYDALCVDARESPQSIRLFAQVGRRAPLHSGGVPKVLLAYLPEAQRRALIEHFQRDPGMPGVVVDPQKLEASLALIRQQGYAVVVDELDQGAHSIAAPIRDAQGHVVAAISIAGPSHRFTEERIQRYIQLVQEAALEISQALGYSVPVGALPGQPV